MEFHDFIMNNSSGDYVRKILSKARQATEFDGKKVGRIVGMTKLFGKSPVFIVRWKTPRSLYEPVRPVDAYRYIRMEVDEYFTSLGKITPWNYLLGIKTKKNITEDFESDSSSETSTETIPLYSQNYLEDGEIPFEEEDIEMSNCQSDSNLSGLRSGETWTDSTGSSGSSDWDSMEVCYSDDTNVVQCYQITLAQNQNVKDVKVVEVPDDIKATPTRINDEDDDSSTPPLTPIPEISSDSDSDDGKPRWKGRRF